MFLNVPWDEIAETLFVNTQNGLSGTPNGWVKRHFDCCTEEVRNVGKCRSTSVGDYIEVYKGVGPDLTTINGPDEVWRVADFGFERD